jgi:hypothetical protein
LAEAISHLLAFPQGYEHDAYNTFDMSSYLYLTAEIKAGARTPVSIANIVWKD